LFVEFGVSTFNYAFLNFVKLSLQCVLPTRLETLECGIATFVVFQADVSSDVEFESDTDVEDVEMQEAEEEIAAMPAKKASKRKAAVLVAEPAQNEILPPPAKQAFLQVILAIKKSRFAKFDVNATVEGHILWVSMRLKSSFKVKQFTSN
jgi:hypothetical protein